MLDLSLASSAAFREDFEREFRRRLASNADLGLAITFESDDVRSARGELLDTSAGWTNALLNMLIGWFRTPDAWGHGDRPIQLVAQPERYRLQSTGKNCHDREYLWDLMASERLGTSESPTWAEWLRAPDRSRYAGALVAVESEWGGELSKTAEDAVELMVDDFYKLCDARVELGIFLHWRPTLPTERALVDDVLAQIYNDHRGPSPIVCIGFEDVDWADLFTEAHRPVLRWLSREPAA